MSKIQISSEKYRYWDSCNSKFWQELKTCRFDKSEFCAGYMACLFVSTIDLVEKIYYYPGIDPFQILCSEEYKERRRKPNVFKKADSSDNPYRLRYFNFETFQSYVYGIHTRYSSEYLSNTTVQNEENVIKLLLNALQEQFNMESQLPSESNSNTTEIYNPVQKYTTMFNGITSSQTQKSKKNDHTNNIFYKKICLSLYHATVTEFMVHLFSVVEILDHLDMFLCFKYHDGLNKAETINVSAKKSVKNTLDENGNIPDSISVVSLESSIDEDSTDGSSKRTVKQPFIYTTSTSSSSDNSSHSYGSNTSMSHENRPNSDKKTIYDDIPYQESIPKFNKTCTKNQPFFLSHTTIESMIHFTKIFILPVLFNTLWIIKSLTKWTEKVATHHIGPSDPNLRLFTEKAFKHKHRLSIFKTCNEEESEVINDALWRCCLKLGNSFNLFGVSISHLPQIFPLYNESLNNSTNAFTFLHTLENIKLSDFDNVFVDEYWFTSLGCVKNQNYKSGGTKTSTKYFNEKPLFLYDVGDIWSIINMLSQKSCRLLDSPELRLFLTIIYTRLYNIFFNQNLTVEQQLGVYNRSKPNITQQGTESCLNYSQTSIYIYAPDVCIIPRPDITNVQESNLKSIKSTLINSVGNPKNYCNISLSTKLFPSFFEKDAVEISTPQKDKKGNIHIKNSMGASRIKTSRLFSQHTESIMSYMVELTSVSDYMFSIYPFQTPKLPSENFCDRWMKLCEKCIKDENLEDFVKKEFEVRFWQLNQFYGETEKFNNQGKISQRNNIKTIIINNRYRHYEVINKVLSHQCNILYDFAMYRIHNTTSNEEMKNLFLSCWDHQKMAYVKYPPSSYIKTIEKYKKGKVSANNAGDITEYTTPVDNDPLSELIQAIHVEQERISRQYRKFSNMITSNTPGNEYVDPSKGGAPTSIVDRALDEVQGFRKIILERESENPDILKDPMFVARKIQHIPVGLLEYNIMQEAIFTVLAIKSAQMNKAFNKQFSVMQSVGDIDDQNDFVFTNYEKGIHIAKYDPKEGISSTGESIYDQIFVDQNDVLDKGMFSSLAKRIDNVINKHTSKSKSANTNTKGNNSGYDADDDNNNNMDLGDQQNVDDDEINILSYMLDGSNPFRQSSNSTYGSDNRNAYKDISAIDEEDEDDFRRFADGYFSLGMHSGSSYAYNTDFHNIMKWLTNEEVQDEEFGIGAENYNNQMSERIKSLHANASRAGGIAVGHDTVNSSITMKEIPKEWPEPMNYDLLELRNKRNKENLETPLTLTECMFKIKRHNVFRRSRLDKPCMFTYFNTYMLCNGCNIMCFSHPFETRRDETCPNLGIYTSPWEFSVVLGCNLNHFCENLDQVIAAVYSRSEFKNRPLEERVVIINNIQNFSQTFPLSIAEATLDSITEYRPTNTEKPIIYRKLVHEGESDSEEAQEDADNSKEDSQGMSVDI